MYTRKVYRCNQATANEVPRCLDAQYQSAIAPLRTRTHWAKYARCATSQGCAHSEMHEAIAQYVEREERREAFREETLKAWEEFQQTGLHASAEDVEKWLSSWGTENEVPAPKCQP